MQELLMVGMWEMEVHPCASGHSLSTSCKVGSLSDYIKTREGDILPFLIADSISTLAYEKKIYMGVRKGEISAL